MERLMFRWRYYWNPLRKFHTFKKACSWCAVRSAIYLPHGKRFWKNNQISLSERVSWWAKLVPLWREYDPRDEDTGSLFMFND